MTAALAGDWLDHTALGFWPVAEEVACHVELLREHPDAAELGWAATEPSLVSETLEAIAGLRSYPAIVAEYCEDLGLQAREWLSGEGRP